MFDANWQSVATLLSVLIAAAYIVRVALRTMRGEKKSSCGDCSGCAASEEVVTVPLTLGDGSSIG